MNGAELLIEFLKTKGVECGFGYPGGPVLVLYEAIYKAKFNHILACHEQGAIHAAEGYAKVTGRPGVVFATSGPGATNLVTGLADARLDSVPILAITGAVARCDTGSDAFQEADITGVTEPVTKYNYLIMNEADLLPSLEEAWELTTRGRPGPVLVNIPKDILALEIKPELTSLRTLKRHRPKRKKAEKRIPRVMQALKEAKRPLLLVGGGSNISTGAPEELAQLTKKIAVPCATTLMGKGAVRNDDPCYLGHIGMHGTVQANRALAECDLLMLLGSRLSDRVIANPDEYRKDCKMVIHIDIDASEIGKNLRPDIEIEDDVAVFLKALNESIALDSDFSPDWSDWNGYLFGLRDRFNSFLDEQIVPDVPLNVSYVMNHCAKAFKGLDPIVTTDVGQHQMFAAQYFDVESPRSFLTSGGLGTMGFGLPASIGASYAEPKRPSVCVCGDGGFQMTIEELGLLARLKLPLLILLMDNSTLGMVRQWQELFFDEHYSESMLGTNPDFVKIADAYGIEGSEVRTAEELDAVLKDFIASPRPYLARVYVKTMENVFPMIPAGRGPKDLIMPGFEG